MDYLYLCDKLFMMGYGDCSISLRFFRFFILMIEVICKVEMKIYIKGWIISDEENI